MTDTTLEIERMGGIYPTLQNKVLAKVMQEAREEIPLVEWTEEEKKFADEINRTSPLFEEGVPPIDDAIKPLATHNGFASTDYGDVMHICPGIQNSECTAATLAGGHSWMITACSGSSIGMKGMLRAGKVMAAGAYKMIEHPELLEEMRAEFEQETKGKPYVCPITDEVAWPYKA